MPLSTPELRSRFVNRVLTAIRNRDFGIADAVIERMLKKFMSRKKDRGPIPPRTAMHDMSVILVRAFRDGGFSLFDTAENLYRAAPSLLSRMYAFGLMTAVPASEYSRILPFIERSAASGDVEERDYLRRTFRHYMKKFPGETKMILRRMIRTRNPRVRQFAAETLRPVGDNAWLFDNPCYCMTVLRPLFREKARDARRAVADTIAAFAQDRPDRVSAVLRHIKSLKDPNGDWIVKTVCSEFVKTDPLEALDILGVREFRVGPRLYSRTDSGVKKKKIRHRKSVSGTC